MRRINLKKTITALSLAAAMAVSSFAIGGDLNTVQAATKKRNVVTKADYNDGSTVKFSYNKKGLITKSVSKKSYKTSDTDVTETVTTKYKYNKKNKIASKTATTVTATTYYSTDKTTGLTVTGTEGTVTTTKIEETKFTYNKKGLAQESVTTTSTVKSGSRTTTSVTNNVIGGSSYDDDDDDYYDDDDDDDYYDDDDDDQTYTTKEMSNGQILAGYNRYKADGTVNHENTSANAFYYTGSVGDGTTTTAETTTYTDNGDGTYKEDVVKTTTRKGYSTSEVELLFARNENNVAVQVTPTKVEKTFTYYDDDDEDEDYYDDEDEDYYDDEDESESAEPKTYTRIVTVYKDANGNEYDDYDFTIVTSVAVAPSSSVSTTTNSKNTVVTDKSVTTTKYSYDKKKRVKKADITTVYTDANTWTSSYSYDGGSYKNGNTNKGEYSKENTTVHTMTYSYDKKGHAKKVTWSDPGVANVSEKESSMQTGSSSQSTYTSYNGATVTENSTTVYACDTYPTVTTTVVKDGVLTVTTTHNPYTRTTDTTSSAGSSSKDITAFSYTANGGRKTVSTYSSGIYNRAETNYSFDKYDDSTAYIRSINGEVERRRYSGTNFYYTGDEAAEKMAGAVAAFDAAIAPYNEVETEAVMATPAQDTTKFKYDKNGNVKTAKKNGTYVDIDTQVNEVYGNTIYEFDAATGKAKPKQIATTHTYTNKDSNDTTVKNGTKNITKQYISYESTEDRSDSGESVIDLVKYKLKGKKASSNAKKQQWILQNGPLNGQVGLD